MSRQTTASRPTSGEAPFKANEIFFSRTDDRGVIASGNKVFQRVADYDWTELLGAPHKVIRHDDMPKAVFWLLWETIKKGQPIGAYVKNLAKDGLYYWVFAIVTPVEGGYLSVRIKPTSDLKKTVEEEYAALRAKEKKEGLSPEASAKLLMARINELGFTDYTSFMAHALSQELASRGEQMGITCDLQMDQFNGITEAVKKVETETAALFRTFEKIRGIPHNMRILASRLEAAGGPISVISANYGIMSHEIGTWVAEFMNDSSSAFSEIVTAVHEGLFLKGTAMVQSEACTAFLKESHWSSDDVAQREAAILKSQAEHYASLSNEGLCRILAQADRFSQAVRDMKRLITGLGATRMMCKIEGARLPKEGESLIEIIRQLDLFQDSIEQRLLQIDNLNRVIQTNAANLAGETSPTASLKAAG
ncbi:MAG: PAS domain-containing protein [Mangrovicoccus sp.]